MIECSPDITVLVATRNRARQLERLLLSLENQTLDGLNCNLIVVDNGSTDDTQSVLRRKWKHFTLLPLYEETAGKSRALNHALEIAEGDLFVFTDDDVTPSPVWLKSLHQASLKYNSAPVFCGPTLPSFPPGTPAWMGTQPFAAAMFAMFAPDLPLGPLPPEIVPFGCNFAARSSAINGAKFRLDLGPSAENGPLFGEDTDFVIRVQGRGQAIFAPDAIVVHHIEAPRIEIATLLERAFHLGRAAAINAGSLKLDQPAIASWSINSEVQKGGLINYYCGQLYQFLKLGKAQDGEARRMLDALEIESSRGLLGESARRFYESLYATGQVRQFDILSTSS